MHDRVAAIQEEIGVIEAMHAHVSDQVEFKLTEHERLIDIRAGLEKRRQIAIAQSKPIKAQEIAIKVCL
jgi:hypothetical protein